MKLYLSEQDVMDCLPMTEAIGLLETAFGQLASGLAVNHPRQRVMLATGSVLHYMAAGTPDFFGLKAYSVNAKTGAHFEVLLYRSEDGTPLATLEANYLGQIRTGAASGLATKLLSRQDSQVAAIIGSGFQAQTQLEAIARVRPLREVRVWSRKPEHRSEFAESAAAKLDLEVRAVETAQECVEGADIVATATSSKEPVLASEWIRPGTHINAAGSNWANRRELPTDLVMDREALVVVDSAEDGMIESGDLLIPMRERPSAQFPAIDLANVISGKLPGRSSEHQITIFKSNGLAVEDIAVAGHVYLKAVERGIGRWG
jgi:alanine dehydrogenase